MLRLVPWKDLRILDQRDGDEGDEFGESSRFVDGLEECLLLVQAFATMGRGEIENSAISSTHQRKDQQEWW